MFVCINDIIESILKYFSEDFACRVYRASRVNVSSCQFISVAHISRMRGVKCMKQCVQFLFCGTSNENFVVVFMKYS